MTYGNSSESTRNSLAAPEGEKRDGLVVMDVDDRADVGPQAQDLAV